MSSYDLQHLYLNLVLVKANHGQRLPHHLPIAAVIDGAHFGTVTLMIKDTYAHTCNYENLVKSKVSTKTSTNQLGWKCVTA